MQSMLITRNVLDMPGLDIVKHPSPFFSLFFPVANWKAVWFYRVRCPNGLRAELARTQFYQNRLLDHLHISIHLVCCMHQLAEAQGLPKLN